MALRSYQCKERRGKLCHDHDSLVYERLFVVGGLARVRPRVEVEADRIVAAGGARLVLPKVTLVRREALAGPERRAS